MRKVWIWLASIAAVVTLSCGLLVGCKNKTEGAEYTVNAVNVGGLHVPRVGVEVYEKGESESGEPRFSGQTNMRGAFSFHLKEGEAPVDFEVKVSCPAGYTEKNAGPYTISGTTRTVDISLSSALITGVDAPENTQYALGDIVYDFALHGIGEGDKTYRLSEMFEEYNMVMLNFWDLSCVPCRSEMPALQQSWDTYKGQGGGLLAVDANVLTHSDTEAGVLSYRNEGYTPEGEETAIAYTMPMALDTSSTQLALRFNTSSVPVTAVIDRYGCLVYRHVGSTDRNTFDGLFQKYGAENYRQDSYLLGGNITDGQDVPYTAPPADIQRPSSAQLAAAASGKDFNGTYSFDITMDGVGDAELSWPWHIGSDADGSYIYPSNTGTQYSFATVTIDFEVQKGVRDDPNAKYILAFDYLISSEEYDYFYVAVDNTLMYQFSGTANKNWQTCYPLVAERAGAHKLMLLYVKDQQVSEGDDMVKVKNIRLISEDEINIPSLDLARPAAYDWSGQNYDGYVDYEIDDQGLYHYDDGNPDTVKGSYIFADLMGVTNFNKRVNNEWSISNYSVAYYFDFNEVPQEDEDGFSNPDWKAELDKTERISEWLVGANNSDLYGLTVVDEELKGLLNDFYKKVIGTVDEDKSWLEFCTWFAHFGNDTSDDGINAPEENPVRGRTDRMAIPVVGYYNTGDDIYVRDAEGNTVPDSVHYTAPGERPYTGNPTIKDDYRNDVLIDRILMPRGMRFSFTPDKDGAYRLHTQSRRNYDTAAWLRNAKGEVLIESDEGREASVPEGGDYNIILTAYLKAGETYYYAVDVADIGNYGVPFTFTVEYLGEVYYSWQNAAREYVTVADEGDLTTGNVINWMNVEPVYSNGAYYDALRDADGKVILDDNRNPQPDLEDPLYIDFVKGTAFSPEQSIEKVIQMGQEDDTVTIVDGEPVVVTEGVLTRVKRIVEWVFCGDSDFASLTKETELTSLIEGEITDEFERMAEQFNTGINGYGESVYIEGADMVEFKTCKTVGDIVEFLRKKYLCAFNFEGLQFADSARNNPYLGQDLTARVEALLAEAKANSGTEGNGKHGEDAGCLPLTEELKNIFELYTRRYGWAELSTDWIRLVKHYEYMGPAKA